MTTNKDAPTAGTVRALTRPWGRLVGSIIPHLTLHTTFLTFTAMALFCLGLVIMEVMA